MRVEGWREIFFEFRNAPSLRLFHHRMQTIRAFSLLFVINIIVIIIGCEGMKKEKIQETVVAHGSSARARCVCRPWGAGRRRTT